MPPKKTSAAEAKKAKAAWERSVEAVGVSFAPTGSRWTQVDNVLNMVCSYFQFDKSERVGLLCPFAIRTFKNLEKCNWDKTKLKINMRGGTNGPIYRQIKTEYERIKAAHDKNIHHSGIRGTPYMETWEKGPQPAWRSATLFVTWYWICHRSMEKEEAYEEAVAILKKKLTSSNVDTLIDEEIAKHRSEYTFQQLSRCFFQKTNKIRDYKFKDDATKDTKYLQARTEKDQLTIEKKIQVFFSFCTDIRPPNSTDEAIPALRTWATKFKVTQEMRNDPNQDKRLLNNLEDAATSGKLLYRQEEARAAVDKLLNRIVKNKEEQLRLSKRKYNADEMFRLIPGKVDSLDELGPIVTKMVPRNFRKLIYKKSDAMANKYPKINRKKWKKSALEELKVERVPDVWGVRYKQKMWGSDTPPPDSCFAYRWKLPDTPDSLYSLLNACDGIDNPTLLGFEDLENTKEYTQAQKAIQKALQRQKEFTNNMSDGGRRKWEAKVNRGCQGSRPHPWKEEWARWAKYVDLSSAAKERIKCLVEKAKEKAEEKKKKEKAEKRKELWKPPRKDTQGNVQAPGERWARDMKKKTILIFNFVNLLQINYGEMMLGYEGKTKGPISEKDLHALCMLVMKTSGMHNPAELGESVSDLKKSLATWLEIKPLFDAQSTFIWNMACFCQACLCGDEFSSDLTAACQSLPEEELRVLEALMYEIDEIDNEAPVFLVKIKEADVRGALEAIHHDVGLGGKDWKDVIKMLEDRLDHRNLGSSHWKQFIIQAGEEMGYTIKTGDEATQCSPKRQNEGDCDNPGRKRPKPDSADREAAMLISGLKQAKV